MLTKLKIGPRIYVSYIVAGLFLIALGIFVALQLRATTKSLQWLAGDLSAYVEAVRTLQSDVSVLTARARARIQTGELDASKRTVKQFTVVRRDLERIANLQKAVSEEGIKADLASWREAVATYKNLYQKADKLVRQNNEAEKAFRQRGQSIAKIAQNVVRNSEEHALNAIYGKNWNKVPKLFRTVTQFSGV